MRGTGRVSRAVVPLPMSERPGPEVVRPGACPLHTLARLRRVEHQPVAVPPAQEDRDVVHPALPRVEEHQVAPLQPHRLDVPHRPVLLARGPGQWSEPRLAVAEPHQPRAVPAVRALGTEAVLVAALAQPVGHRPDQPRVCPRVALLGREVVLVVLVMLLVVRARRVGMHGQRRPGHRQQSDQSDRCDALDERHGPRPYADPARTSPGPDIRLLGTGGFETGPEPPRPPCGVRSWPRRRRRASAP